MLSNLEAGSLGMAGCQSSRFNWFLCRNSTFSCNTSGRRWAFWILTEDCFHSQSSSWPGRFGCLSLISSYQTSNDRLRNNYSLGYSWSALIWAGFSLIGGGWSSKPFTWLLACWHWPLWLQNIASGPFGSPGCGLVHICRPHHRSSKFSFGRAFCKLILLPPQ